MKYCESCNRMIDGSQSSVCPYCGGTAVGRSELPETSDFRSPYKKLNDSLKEYMNSLDKKENKT